MVTNLGQPWKYEQLINLPWEIQQDPHCVGLQADIPPTVWGSWTSILPKRPVSYSYREFCHFLYWKLAVFVFLVGNAFVYTWYQKFCFHTSSERPCQTLVKLNSPQIRIWRFEHYLQWLGLWGHTGTLRIQLELMMSHMMNTGKQYKRWRNTVLLRIKEHASISHLSVKLTFSSSGTSSLQYKSMCLTRRSDIL